MRGGTIVGRIVLAVAGLVLVVAAATYFINPFHTPIGNPTARVLGYAIYRMPSVSMEPTFRRDSVFIVNAATLRDRDPRPGEIVVFLHPSGNGMYVKRVVAVGGSTIAIRSGAVVVDGLKLDEPYVAHPYGQYVDAPRVRVPK